MLLGMSKKALLFILIAFMAFPVRAQDIPPAFRSTDYPLPRFVSLGADEIFVRAGPGLKFPVKWVFRKRGLPVEVVLEYESWRKIRDSEGGEGWVHSALLSGSRSGRVRAEKPVPVRQKPAEQARLRAYIEPGALAALKACEGGWCKIEAVGYSGWMERQYIWGVYENEDFD
jgi:SH3-like domain-containing protein